MSLFHAKDFQLGYIIGKVVLSGSCTDVVGGTMTAGTFDNQGSGLITFAPPFISAPTIIAQGCSAAAATATLMPVNVTGVTVSNCYVECYASGGSVNLVMLGLQNL